ncbi:hypothetical protein DENIS_4455 [Desulfonema ishimotonii]|uniref:RHS repeat-associated core domain-containing pro tein n=1 Tax=Desulfonema ishimotonii TaxID=45657 RepID=A0A401G2R1_9BACT|nr:RHS repeat-associated core domain-containing protein [Desulfonema ishimotonii]GBC63461.1 hypothetical protein DENIS_4455 [Desulfonema ishimotonii]
MAAPAATVDAEGRLYEYDPIGNRTYYTEGTAPQVEYERNRLNQYIGLSADGSALPSPSYDDDGNMTGYDGAAAENRLTAVETADRKITFLYDYMGRRVRKKVYSGTPGSWNTVPDETRVFVYDGWNLIKETVTGDTGDTYYVWGPDLSQSMQGAGGIGGLVCRVSGTAVRHYTYDANGNVGQLVDEAGAIVAHYEYDPFGNEIRAEGDDAQNNPFRSSTKYLDAETGLYYYGFRYYSPEIGRWISRDPMGEQGGINIYGFVDNNTLNNFDILGMWEATKESRGEARRRYLRTDANDTLDTLAEIVGLEKTEKQKWAKIEDTNSSITNTGKACRVSVPNVWISADLLRGATWWGLNPWDRFVNIGGTLGRFIGTSIFTSGDFKIIKPNTPKQLKEAIKNNAGDIWGIVIFAHGTKEGYIADGAAKTYTHQMSILKLLDRNKFKVAKAYAMQCYSAFRGNINIPYTLEPAYRNFGFSTVDKDPSDLLSDWEIKNVNWEDEWRKRAKYFYGYSGANALMIDIN